MSPLHICIVGTGWYGCHAAMYLRNKGITVSLYDKSNAFFTGASCKNQNRLHLGYHYPRSKVTIEECQEGYTQFIEMYPHAVVSFDKNYYLFHKDSKVNYDMYVNIFGDLKHDKVTISTLGIQTNNLDERMFRVEERLIDNVAAKEYFELHLQDCFVRTDTIDIQYKENGVFVNGIHYDYLLNCTNNQWQPIPFPYKAMYENVCTLVYHISFDTPTALTVMDGLFFSIYPYDIEQKLYTVTHVNYSVINRTDTCHDIEYNIDDIRTNIESAIQDVFPTLLDKMTYRSYFVSKKTKYDIVTDDRSLRYHKEHRYASFSGGKITGIFHMTKVLDEVLLEITQ